MFANRFLEDLDADVLKCEPMLRETGDGHGFTLVATDAGLAAISFEPDDANTALAGATDAFAGPNAALKARTLREDTK